MPNWVTNNLTVSGPKDILASFIQKAQGNGTNLNFDNLFPIPQELKNRSYGAEVELKENPNLTKIDGHISQYDWCIDNWGTKWNNDENVEQTQFLDTEVHYFFETAWDSILPLIVKVSKDFPQLSFQLEFSEPNMQFYGNVKIKNGEEHDCVELDGEEAVAKIGERLGIDLTDGDVFL